MNLDRRRPTGNLDKATGESIIKLFKRLAAENGLAILITTHNPVFGYEADRAITLEDGRIVKEEALRSGTSWTGLTDPKPEPAQAST